MVKEFPEGVPPNHFHESTKLAGPVRAEHRWSWPFQSHEKCGEASFRGGLEATAGTWALPKALLFRARMLQPP
jgi:hypothetical protein